MIKTILVPATGSDADNGVFSAALAVARPLGAHLGFLHLGLDAATFAATIMPEVGSGRVVTDVIARMEMETQRRKQKAKHLFESFCEREGLVIAETPSAQSKPSAKWFEERGSEAHWLAEYARAADLVVVGRSDDRGVPSDLLETALMNSGRPLLIPPSASMSALPKTVVIAWKSTPEAARAVTAAMPLLALANQIVIMTVAEDENAIDEEAPARLMANLRWDGFSASVRGVQPGAQGAAETLLGAAHEQAALLVMGGYGHSRVREWIFGGFTRRILHDAEIPVLIAH